MPKKKKQKFPRIKTKLVQLNEKHGTRLFRIFQVILVVAFVTVITLLLEHAGWLHGFEQAAMDAWLRAEFNLAPGDQSKQVLVVNIDDEDYLDIFQRKSPLDKGALEGIITAIASAKPLLIGIDIDTSDEEFGDFKFPQDVPIVWAEDALVKESNHSDIRVFAALGGAKSASTLTGLVVMPTESDGIVRSYIRTLRSHDSFAWVLAKTYCAHVEQAKSAQPDKVDASVLKRCADIRGMTHEPAHEPAHDEELMLDLRGGQSRFQHISARELLDARTFNRTETLSKLEGRAVLLGGTFHAGRDEYTTPLGRMSGVELVAHSLESELHGPFRKPTSTIMLVLNVVGGICILLLFIYFGVKKGCLFSLAAMIIIAPLWSLIAFGSLTFVGYFVVILIALLIHQLYEQAHYIQHKFLHHLKPEKEPETKP